MQTLGIVEARRLALACAGLLKPEWTGFPTSVRGWSSAREAAHDVIRRFGYLQLDTVSVSGARSHTIVLLSRLRGFDPTLAEKLLRPDEPLFEYWGHEASWLPIELYPVFEFRRKAFHHHPWWGDLIGQHPKIAENLRRRVHEEGPLRSADMEGRGGRGWWDLKTAKRVATALWSSGEFAIRDRYNFQRTYDLAERVIPERWRLSPVSRPQAIQRLLLLALQGHGWASTSTLVQTWRLDKERKAVDAALNVLVNKGDVVPCNVFGRGSRKYQGWIRPQDIELAARLKRVRPRRDRGVLLSPFDPVLWDRRRVERLFDFHQVLEIFKPRAKRVYGYYCLPVLAGDRLVARLDLKACRKTRKLNVLAQRFEDTNGARAATADDREAARTALNRFARALNLEPVGSRLP
ncbi:MAG: winged helix-turn-helix domain-containing protein [Gemmatimonadales bacterium]